MQVISLDSLVDAEKKLKEKQNKQKDELLFAMHDSNLIKNKVKYSKSVHEYLNINEVERVVAWFNQK